MSVGRVIRARVEDRRFVTRTEDRTAKVRRIHRDPLVRVLPCDPRGKPLGPGVEGRARISQAEEECERAEAALDRHYGRTRRIYETLIADARGMVHVEVDPAEREATPST
jgi:PPOX class probable F420-dependent enzyme